MVVVDINPNGKAHVATLAASIEDLIYDYVNQHDGKITVAEAIGCLSIVSYKMLKALLD